MATTNHKIGTAVIKDDEAGGLELSGNVSTIGNLNAGFNVSAGGNISNTGFGTNRMQTDFLDVEQNVTITGSLNALSAVLGGSVKIAENSITARDIVLQKDGSTVLIDISGITGSNASMTGNISCANLLATNSATSAIFVVKSGSKIGAILDSNGLSAASSSISGVLSGGVLYVGSNFYVKDGEFSGQVSLGIGGTALISTTKVTGTSCFNLQPTAIGGGSTPVGMLYPTSSTAGVGFEIASTSGSSDASLLVDWSFVNRY